MYNLAKIAQIKNDILHLADKLRCWQVVQDISLEDLQKMVNGCGAEWMPFWARYFLDAIMNLECSVAIHDVMYGQSDGTFDSQKFADDTFFANGHIELYAKYRWYSGYRYWSLFKLTFAYKALRKFGHKAFMDAYKDNINKKEK